MNDLDKLKTLLESMDVPDMRRDVGNDTPAQRSNVRWLQRNLAVRNSNNTSLRETFRLLRSIGKV